MTTVAEAQAQARPEPARPVKLEHMPGLDGLRALWLPPVLIGHAGFAQYILGGWIAVSSFFTISGFLITSLAIIEYERTDHIAMVKFWVRRFRRLLPAAIVTLGVIAILSAIHPFWPRYGLKDDMASALFYVANWRFIATSHGYEAIFRSVPSPIIHFWSLSLEEQYYLIFPLLMTGLLVLRKRWRWSTVVILLVIWGLSAVRSAMWFSDGKWSDAYYSTDSRLGELMMGSLLALFMMDPRITAWRATTRGKRIVTVVTFICQILWVVVCFKLPLTSPLVYHGGLLVVSVIVAGGVLSVIADTPLRRLTSNRAMCWVGTRVYGLYLIHFPVFIILRPARLHAYVPWPTDYGQLRWVTLVVGTLITMGLAGLSHRYIETPIRNGRWLPGRKFYVAAPAAMVGVLALIMFLPFKGTDEGNIALRNISKAAREREQAQRAVWDASKTRILVVGDSMSWVVANGIDDWGRRNGAVSLSVPRPGCGALPEGQTDYMGIAGNISKDCTPLPGVIRTKVADLKPTAVVILSSGRDLSDVSFADGYEGHVGEPGFDRRMSRALSDVVDAAARTGVPTYWLLEPHVRATGDSEGSWKDLPENEPARMDRLNELIVQAVDRAPAGSKVKVLDLGAFSRRHAGGEFDTDFRPDGAHFSRTGAREVATWLMPQILATNGATGGSTPSTVRPSTTAPAPGAPPTTVAPATTGGR